MTARNTEVMELGKTVAVRESEWKGKQRLGKETRVRRETAEARNEGQARHRFTARNIADTE